MTDFSVEIRLYEPEFCDEIARLENETFSCPRGRDMIIYDGTAANAVTVVALCGGRLAGYGGFNFVLDEGYINNILTVPDFRRMGIASAVMAALDEQAAVRRLSFLTLEVRRSNTAAKALYKKCGYTLVGERRGYYVKPKEDALLFTKFYCNGDVKK